MNSAITAIGTATPVYTCSQSDIAGLMAKGLHLSPARSKILHKIYAASGIEQRHSVLADYARELGEFEFLPNEKESPFPTTKERMSLYKAHALGLAISAIEDCLVNAPCQKEITHLITVSCTGMYAPGIDIEIVQHLQLSSSVKRTAVHFMGCYGAFNALKVADSISRAEASARVLVVCVELCSLHLQKEFTMDNIISNALFADGAAAVLIEQPLDATRYLKFETFHCDIVPQTQQEMTWHISDFGFEMVLSAYVPEAIKLGIHQFSQRLLKNAAISLQDIDYYAIHPGGVAILEACEESLGISPEDNRFSYDVLRQNGNMSSATILFVLKAIWKQLGVSDHHKTIFCCAFGPGLTLESMLLRGIVLND
jgi:alpha-pyrone synthase